jgi:O-antigen/teichoic acid export membrane protein
MKTQRVGLSSALTYAPISLAAAGIFLAITLNGDYTWVARVGGAVWVFILSMIISMPLITSYYKRRYQPR